MVFGQLVMPVQCCAGAQDDVMSLGINLGAQHLGPNSWKYLSPIFVGQVLKICFTHIRRSDSWKYLSTNSVKLVVVHLSWIYCGSIGNLSRICRGPVPDASSWRIKFMKIMEFCLKWVHMARYELILRLVGALWLRSIFKPLLTPQGSIVILKWPKQISKLVGTALE